MLSNFVATPAMVKVAAEMTVAGFARSYVEFILRTSHRATDAQADDAMRIVRVRGAANAR